MRSAPLHWIPSYSVGTLDPRQYASGTRPPEVELARSISTAFAKQYPPRHGRSLEIDPSTLMLGATKNRAVTFTFTAKASQGESFGTIDLGTQRFRGSFDLRTGAVYFEAR